jgi:hypothetical protein
MSVRLIGFAHLVLNSIRRRAAAFENAMQDECFATTLVGDLFMRRPRQGHLPWPSFAPAKKIATSVEEGLAGRAAPIALRGWLKENMKALLPDTIFLSLLHKKEIGRFPNLIRPRTFNEHILMRNLRPDPRYAALTDKLSVREYVRRNLGEQFLVPLICAPAEFSPAVFDMLPSSFVMKANHGSAFVEVVHDKSKYSFDQLQGLAVKWVSTDFYKVCRERHYKNIEPRIFFEKLSSTKTDRSPPTIRCIASV